jgi:hypothetical protein
MKLTDDAKQWHRLWSVRLAVISAVFAALEASLPLWESTLPDGAFAAASTVCALGVGVVRVLKQKLPGRDDG